MESNKHSVKTNPARFSVACNFDPELIHQLAKYPVYEVYGKLTSDFFGGGRPSFYLPAVDKKGLEDYVRHTHRHGMEFNYLLNSSSMNNVEFCRYCHEWAEKCVHIQPEWRRTMTRIYDELLGDLHSGSLWESYFTSLKRVARKVLGKSDSVESANMVSVRLPGGEPLPNAKGRRVGERQVYPKNPVCIRPKPEGAVSVGNMGQAPTEAVPFD
ncbi:MAG TPA: hypothetical protein VNJ07_03170 [Chitinophagales bacterium]|nr:hypothetical protein [Chitinophagales bacterium]